MIYLVYWFYLGVLAIAAGVAAISAWFRVRRGRVDAVIQTLAGIVSHNLPLATVLRASARGERRRLREILSHVAQRLEYGEDLSVALQIALPACPGEVIGALQGAERGGTLRGVLASLASRTRQDARRSTARGVPAWYWLLLLVVLPLVSTFFLVVVLPKLREIFEDFDTPLPAVTVQLLGVASPLADYAPLLVIAILVMLVAVPVLLVTRHFFPRRPGGWQPSFAVWDLLAWSVPGLRQVARNRALGQQLLIMQAALRAGHDLTEAAEQGCAAEVNWLARRRLRCWADVLKSGATPAASARALGFPSPVVSALLTAANDGELAARIEYLADYYESLRDHWRRVLLAALTPVVVMGWALLVAFVVLATFVPLKVLLDAVIAQVY
ncbi:MAG: Type II secretion system protein F [Phycisphaerae bacterium]|nr:Type II secretion system protein F [Phycisphaerae bacterium]